LIGLIPPEIAAAARWLRALIARSRPSKGDCGYTSKRLRRICCISTNHG
jgi:hypothetical protein